MKYFTCVLTLLLSACASVGARSYDPAEYSLAVSISANTTHAIHRCDSMANSEFQGFIQKVNLDSFTLVEFVSNKADSVQAKPSAEQVRNLISEFFKAPKPTFKYCVHKLSNVQASSRMLARALGGYSQISACEGSVQARYALFEASYLAKNITEAEFKELVDDLMNLKSIDSYSCTLEERRELEQALKIIQLAVRLLL